MARYWTLRLPGPSSTTSTSIPGSGPVKWFLIYPLVAGVIVVLVISAVLVMLGKLAWAGLMWLSIRGGNR